MNPAFYVLFICPILTLPLATILNYNSAPALVFKLLLVASSIYLAGSFLVTILGNIPLNNLLHRNDLEKISIENTKDLRSKIEEKWNAFNLIRTITNTFANFDLSSK